MSIVTRLVRASMSGVRLGVSRKENSDLRFMAVPSFFISGLRKCHFSFCGMLLKSNLDKKCNTTIINPAIKKVLAILR